MSRDRDPIDQLGARLFQVAREEQPPSGAEQRALEEARRVASARLPTREAARRVRPKLLLLAASLALVCGAVLLDGREQPPTSISREPLASLSGARAERVPTPPAASHAVVEAAEPSVAARVVPTPVRSVSVTLSDELELLKVAQSALGAGDTAGALKALDRYDHTLKGNKAMRAEATLLRIETLSRAGQTSAAAALARRFIEQHPTSPLVDRARSLAALKEEK
jgi:hypothetical protein